MIFRLPRLLLGFAIVLGTFLYCFTAATGKAHAQYPSQEVITYYDSRITVNTDGSLLVKEEIDVQSTGDKIRHGIYRDFPTKYALGWGFEKKVGFKVLAVFKNGQPEPYSLSKEKNGVRIYIGNPSVLLSSGLYRYEIDYQTDRQLGVFPSYDELYYNITGNGWEFPINQAFATVILPAAIGERQINALGYIGLQGSKERVTSTIGKNPLDGKRVITVGTTRPLEKYEGLTVAVSWPKGFVTPPSAASTFWNFLLDNLLLVGGILLTAGLFIYLVTIWLTHGRDPQGKMVITLFSPPQGISPALCRFINRMAYDQKHLTVTLVSLAVKRFLKIQKKISTFSVEKLPLATASLTDDEKDVAQEVFVNDETVFSFSPQHYGQVKKIIAAHKSYFEETIKNIFVVSNDLFIRPGIIATIVYFVCFVITYSLNGQVWVFLIELVIWSIVVGALSSLVYTYWKADRRREMIIMGLFVAPFVGGEAIAIGQLAQETSFAVIALLVIQVVLLFVFFLAFRARTLKGKEIEDQIQGFKAYLLAVEKRRYELDAMPIPERLSMYERYLPYAIALDIEPEWTKQFDETLKALSPEEKEEYLSWYGGYHFSSLSGSSPGFSFGNSLTGAISSSSVSPGSSSGSGGGGSSGGGGGGGGGGGW